MLLPGYINATRHKNKIVEFFITSVLYYRDIMCLLGIKEKACNKHFCLSADYGQACKC